MLLSEAGFFFYCFLPLLPFLLLGIWRLKNFQLRSWILVSLILLFVPMVSPSNLRWVLMLTYPLAFCAIETLSRLKSVSWKRFGFTLRRIGIVYLVLMVSVLSLGFMLMPPENPFPYFGQPVNGYIYQIPSSMLQNTVPKIDCADTVNALQWFKNNVDSSALLLTHRAFYGWAMLTANVTQIILYEYDNPVNAAKTVTQQEQGKIYLIWWVNGTRLVRTTNSVHPYLKKFITAEKSQFTHTIQHCSNQLAILRSIFRLLEKTSLFFLLATKKEHLATL